MEELADYEKELAQKYEGKKAFDIACNLAFSTLMDEKEEQQQIPSYDTYRKYETIKELITRAIKTLILTKLLRNCPHVGTEP